MISFEKPGTPAELNHHGVKGMHWGVRKEGSSGSGRARRVGKAVGKAVGAGIDNTVFELSKKSDAVTSEIAGNAAEKLHGDLPGIKARHGDYGKLRNRVKKPFSPEAKAYRKDVTATYLKHLESSANEMTNVRGTRQYTLQEHGEPNTSKYFWKVSTQSIQHADDLGMSIVHPIFDDEGYIVDVEVVDETLMQSGMTMNDFFTHSGVLGMKWGVRKSQATRDFNAKFTTRKARTNEIQRARVAQLSRRQQFKAAPKGSAQRSQLKADFLTHPDRATALRLTTGEKFVFAAFSVPNPTIPVLLGVRKGVQRNLASQTGG